MSWEEVLDRLGGGKRALGFTNLGGRDSEEIEERYEKSNSRVKKNMSVQSLQIAVDGYLEGKVSEEEYLQVKDSTLDNVKSFYAGNNQGEIYTPTTDRETRESGLPGDDAVIESWAERLDYGPENIEKVVPVAAGGLEPGIVAGELLDAELSVVRYSKNDHGDETVQEVDGDYSNDDVLIVDDNSYTGETLSEVEEYVSEEAKDTYAEAVVEGEVLGQAKAIIPHLNHRSWRHRQPKNNPLM
ncbi:MAG: hypothetical protein BRC29_03335 [Nanohaloarchaea archaeon SW_7_43_1]|nr:MAG: hypothetical protein BRC29_03335 [Nanohaloarchaea archaeon SW_7_43_1]